MSRISTWCSALTLTTTLAFVPSVAFADGGLRKGPWLMEPRADSVTVMLERESRGPVQVRAWPVTAAGPSAGGLQVQSEQDHTLHEVRLGGLTAGGRYHYEVSGPGITPVVGTFATPPSGAAPFRFVIYGDTRSDAVVHGAITRAIESEGAEFIVHTGDMVANGTHEEQWQEFFDIERDLLRNAPLLAVVGNHEMGGQSRLGLQNFRRYVHVTPESPDPELDFVHAWGNVRIIVANAFADWSSAPVRTWLDEQLGRARAEVPDGFVLVAMHWGVCSSGPHGENTALRDAGIAELFRRHRVDLVIAGHDHHYERGDDHGLRYMVSGGGGAGVYRRVRPNGYTQLYVAEHHYVRADVERDRIAFTALRPDGSIVDRCALTRTGWTCSDAQARSGGGRVLATTEAGPRWWLGALVAGALGIVGLARWRRRR